VFGRFPPAGNYHHVYLMYSWKLGYRIGRTGGTRTNGDKAYPGFVARLRQERGDSIWLLKACTEPSEAAYWEARLSVTYGVPTTCFYSNGRRMAMDDEQIVRLYRDLDTRSAAERLAADLGISLDYPHHVPQATIRGGTVRKTISFTMFGSATRRLGRNRWHQLQDPWHQHELSICSSDHEFRQQVERVWPTKRHKELYWAARRAHGSYDDMQEMLDHLRQVAPDALVWRRARFTQESYNFMPIGHLLPGALVPILGEDGCISEDEVVSVTRREYDGPVYDLSVPTYRNYIAGGIVVHNSIYRFRGADYRNVLQFRRDYPDAVVVLLEQNYRSTQTILDAANAVIAQNRNRTPKQLHTQNGTGTKITVYEAYNEIEEAAYVCDEIERLVATRAFGVGDIAVMYRTNAQSRALEEAMVMRQMRYKLIGATRFYERKEVKDALAYMRLIHNPDDSIALDRIANVPARGIGLKTYSTLKEWAGALGVSEYDALRVLNHGPDAVETPLPADLLAPGFTARARSALTNFATMAETWVNLAQRARYESVAALMDLVLQDSGYNEFVQDGTEEGEERFANLQELRSVAAQYVPGMPGLEENDSPLALFLQEVSLVSEADQVDEGAGAVTLMTLHTAKGLEYPIVFMVGLEEGILPHSRSLESGDAEDMEEERRLVYVGITRAKKRLYLVHAFRRSLWGSSEVQEVSRFILDVPEELLAGMVDRRARREAAYRRETTWDQDNDYPTQRPDHSRTAGMGGRPRNRDTGAAQGTAARADAPRQVYWSPGGGANRPATPTEGREAQYRRRDSVQHAQFGVGTVIESTLVGDDEEVTVAFPGIGIKKLLASVAKLKKL
jgi:DNA helicase II / ATP-dependent DNA helicase PcrA